MTTMTRTKQFFAAAALAGAVFALGGCAGALEGGLTPVEDVTVTPDGAAAQVMLEPVDVWDDEGAGGATSAEVDGRTLQVRKRSRALFRQAWVRLGLYWNSKRPDDVFIAAVALGPEVEVRALRMEIDGRAVNLEKTGDFHFIPGKRGVFDTREKHVGSFIADVGWLREVVGSRSSAVVALETSRGVLAGDVNVVAGDLESDLRKSAKNKFAAFLEAQRQAARQ